MFDMSEENVKELVAGVDEASRGCLYGRVYIAAVIWDHGLTIQPPFPIRDSKKITPARRNKLRHFIEEHAIDYCVTYMEHDEIDKMNILQATMKGMHKAINGLKIRPHKLLIDGNRFISYIDHNTNQIIPHECIVGGDDIHIQISAASILAKEIHDEYIRAMCSVDPLLDERYGLLKNKGYGTKQHMEGLRKYGPSPHHRITFNGVLN